MSETPVVAVVAPAVEAVVPTEKTFTFEELKGLSTKSDLHLLISGKVYAIAKFLDEHPGGDEVLFGEVGRDATEAFEDVGHSDEARELLAKYIVGNGPEGTAPKEVKKVRTTTSSEGGSSFTYLLPLAGLVGYLAYRFYETQTVVA